jgi:hypothetical protein
MEDIVDYSLILGWKNFHNLPPDSVKFRESAKKDFQNHIGHIGCQENECLECGSRDCPVGEPMHYHHDGCPGCPWG